VRRCAAILAFALALLIAPDAQAALPTPGLASVLPPHLRSQVGAPLPPPRQFISSFVVEADDGYKVKVGTTGSAVILEVSHRHGRGQAETAYLARGVATPERLQATFGRFGRVSMHFRQAAGAGNGGAVCRHGERFLERRGVFVGSFEFEGEGGYLRVARRRVKGTIRRPAGFCPRRHHHGDFSILFEQPAGMFAVSRDGVDVTVFFTFEFGGQTEYFAAREETRGKLAIARFAAVPKGKPFHINEAATAVKLVPPAPFHGSGLYRAAPDGTSTWSGRLSVNFPGAPRYPLTGPRFQVFLEAPF
jgi:hypothetical protein